MRNDTNGYLARPGNWVIGSNGGLDVLETMREHGFWLIMPGNA